VKLALYALGWALGFIAGAQLQLEAVELDERKRYPRYFWREVTDHTDTKATAA
jgi:hypothetical protein